MSVEAETRKALRRAAFWRSACVAIELPRGIANSFLEFFDGVSYAAFYMELDAARRYRLLSGVDLGVASGSTRYVGMTPEALEKALDDAESGDDD